MGKLHDQMKMDLELKGYSEKTRQCYLERVGQFARHFQRSAAELGTEEIRIYLHYLITERGLSQSYISQAYSALKFFYATTLGRSWDVRRIPRTKRVQTLPVVLSEKELGSLFSVLRNVKHRALLVTLYSAGLRVGEGTRLQVSDLDSDRMTIRVRSGKAGITKAITAHSLRHSFATHLIESGVDIYHIQRLLGHSTVETTARYVHLTPHDLGPVVSPLDRWTSFALSSL